MTIDVLNLIKSAKGAKVISDRIILINGDMRDYKDLFPPRSIDIIITDPPYAMNYVSNHRKNKFEQIVGDDAVDKDWFWMCQTVKRSGAFYCFHKWTVQNDFLNCIKEYPNITVRNQLLWIKNNDTGGDLKRAYGEKHENIWFATGDDFYFPNGRPTTDIYADRVASANLIHPNQKPVSLIRKLMSDSLDINDTNALVFDPFMGSGSTGVVAVDRGYRFIGIEIDEKYFKYAVNRISDMVNQMRLF